MKVTSLGSDPNLREVSDSVGVTLGLYKRRRCFVLQLGLEGKLEALAADRRAEGDDDVSYA
jgi:hypothetical protein